MDSSKKLVGYIRRKKIRECSMKSLEDRLTAEEKDRIYRLYAQGYGLPEEYKKEVNLLLTGPLVSDGGAKNEKEQLQRRLPDNLLIFPVTVCDVIHDAVKGWLGLES